MPTRRGSERGDESLIKRQKTDRHNAEDAPYGAAGYLFYLFLIFGIATGVAIFCNKATPVSIPSSASANVFSEERALAHVTSLTDFGVRLVGTPQLDQAAEYVMTEARKLVQQAELTRPDLLVQVSQEFYSGAVTMPFINKEFVNMYNNITNVILVVSPRAGLKEKSVLVNAHFDSALGSPGASDDASCVGIMLEIARLLIADPSRVLAAPIVFLMNGAEEALCPASHAFMQQSPWAKDIGVFLNLESTGNQGPDFLFQQTGAWPMETYYRVAPYPRGSVVAQDIFQLGIIPAETDNRFFSANVQGSLPGLDIAFLLGAGAYHTDRDTVQNIRKGTVQGMGENALAFVVEAGKDLAVRNMNNNSEIDTQRTVFFDVLGFFMVTYSFKVASLVHSAPLVIALSLPYLQRHTLPPHASLFKLYASIAFEALITYVSIVTTMLSALFVALFRVTLFGKPMSWHSDPVTAPFFLVPAAVAGALLPYLGRKIDPKVAGMGNVLAFALFSAFTIHCGLGMGFFTVIWAITGMASLSDWGRDTTSMLRTATLQSVFPIMIFLPNSISLTFYMLQKANFLGAQGQPHYTSLVADGVAGVVVGMSTCVVLGILPPWIAFAVGKRGLKRVVLFFFMTSAFFAGLVTLGNQPYSRLAPKKVFIQHLHKIQQDGSLDSVLAVGAVDSIPVTSLLADQRFQDFTAREGFQHIGKTYIDAPKTGWEWQTTYPFNEEFVNSVVLKDDEQHEVDSVPGVILLAESPTSHQGLSSKRLHLMLDFHHQHYFGAVNLTGPILDWSFPKLQKAAQTEGEVHSRYIRFCGKGGEKDWQFWVDLPQDASLSVRLAAADSVESQAVAGLTKRWPAWTFVASATSYASEFSFS